MQNWGDGSALVICAAMPDVRSAKIENDDGDVGEALQLAGIDGGGKARLTAPVTP